ncbi:MAG: L-threo-3-hydroxyaspartate ammonia-lyase (EC [uncultured Paraburkholderia sp.]|nr:MAG: L-threo-3-hydroxyaspartate ammonia-lyase (EC [uncultured Paraburkholderia sp.]CAH2938436.1 MAG: L-threo-3-hydroxyaspartate ammonia-lyase (EC [uncultured Paraburkholderia sp.]
MPTFDDVAAAARRIEDVAHRTPVMTSRTVNEAFGTEVFFKCENHAAHGRVQVSQRI